MSDPVLNSQRQMDGLFLKRLLEFEGWDTAPGMQWAPPGWTPAAQVRGAVPASPTVRGRPGLGLDLCSISSPHPPKGLDSPRLQREEDDRRSEL